MGVPSGQDPVRATLVAILKQLNEAERLHEGRAEDQSLTLKELERRLAGFWAIDDGTVKLPLALGLLLRNKMVAVRSNPAYSWQRQRSISARYHITVDGKKFLVDSLEKTDRIA